MKLKEARIKYSRLLAQLVLWIFSQGYEVAFDEGMDRITAKDPTSDHMKNSLHELGLAQDLLIYKGGTYLTATEDYKFAGEKWESMHPLCRWGGRFQDGDHFSFAPPEIVGNKK